MSELLYTQKQLIQVRNENYNAGVETERKRIIKLLEAIHDYPQGWDYDNPIESVIALIKGETK